MTEFTLPTDFDLGEHFDHRTLTRAIELQTKQSVLAMRAQEGKLAARVRGSRANVYALTIELVMDRRLGLKLQGQCSCAEANNCKHVAATLMAFEADQVRRERGLPETVAPAIPLTHISTHTLQREVLDLGVLSLQPVLRLGTCADVASEAMLHHRYSVTSAHSSALKQASAQLILRYQPPYGPAIDYHFPAGGASTTFIEQPDPELPGSTVLARFERQSQAESAAFRAALGVMTFRPWSSAANLALERLARLSAGRSQASVIPPALEDTPMIFVALHATQWPTVLAQHVPDLASRGWAIEVASDFPFEMHSPDEWLVKVDEEPGSEWFSVGLKVTVEGQSVNLVPLLIGLVQSGWLKLDTTQRESSSGDVLVPWPWDNATTAPRRQRLLRLPMQRVAPLMNWLRAVFVSGQKNGHLRLSRFDLGALETMAAHAKVTAPPSFTQLIEQVRLLGSGETLPAVEPSPNVQATLRHYQLDGLAWIDFLRRARLGGILADDMGLGKTLQTLALLQGELDAGRLERPSLIVVPTSLIGNWQAEARRFTPALKVLVMHGAQRTKKFPQIEQAHIVITSYQLVVRDIAALKAQHWHYLVLDEAQRIKNSRSQAALSLKELRANHRLCLSGTPLENHLGELWSLLDFVCPGLLGGEMQFREHYRTPIEKHKDTIRADQLARRVRPFILRRTKQQVAQELPAKTETLLRIDLSGAQRDLYETVRATMDKKLREAIQKQGLARSRIMVLDALLKLRQVCCDPRLLKVGATPGPSGGKVAHSAKMDLLLELLPILIEDGRRVLLFSQFTEMLALIELDLHKLKLPYLKLTGESQNRTELVAQFQKGDVPLFLISLKAGSLGLNLTAADTVILYDPWWNPAVEQQAIDRAYRIGQDKPVFVYKLLATGTVEDKMLELQARKAGLADMLLSGVASDAALNAQDFDELFKPLGGD